ncbi:MAG TPA: nuclease domain-containing protein [Terriglobales bacterium]|jgi:hypothetical protein|nr:nuclease domain-containing protein [Terriglobales bacterium]
MDITRLCRDQPCYIRLPNVCNHDPATSVPAHIRLAGVSGMGFKAPDIFVCPACQNCHDAVDRRRFMELDRDYVQLAHYQGVIRWQNELYKRELICIGAGA